MANIDELNFEVILKDDTFTQKVQADIKLAKELNTQLSTLLTIKKQVGTFSQADVVNNRKAGQILVDNARVQEKITREKIKTEGVQKRINAQIDKATKGYQSQSRILNELKGIALGYLSVQGASQLLSSLVRVTGEFELQKTTLAAMLGDLNKAEEVITKIQGLAVESPFQFKELTTYAKQLSAFSVPAEELYDTTKMLADVSAGLGVGMDRIVLAYGQVRSAAFLRGQEVRQFTEAGIPILDELAKQFTELEGRAVSTSEVFDKISKRLVPFEMVAKVFKDMTSEGGKFYNMQEVQAETLQGKISNLKDAYEVMLNEIGSAHSDKLKGAIDGVRSLMQNWEKIGGQLVDLIKLFGAYKVAVGLLGISDTIAKFGGLAKAIKSTAAAQRLMNSALMTNPYIAVATAITAVAIAISRHRKELGDTTAAQNEYNRRVKELERIDRERASAVRNLIDTVQDETRATVEREAALMSLKGAYPDIFAQYDIESLKLADILKIKKQISEEDAKQRKVEAYGSLGAQEGRIKALIARGASDTHIESATAVLREMQKGYLEKYVLPDMVSGLRDMTDDALNKALQEAYRKSQYNTIGIEQIEGIPTTQDFYEDLYAAIQAEIKRRSNTKLVDGWRKKVQDTLSDLGLDEGTSFGLWAKDTTQSTEYVDDMIKRYKELGEQIRNVSPFDKEQTERLQKNKDAIEAVAKALNIDIKNLAASKGDTAESKEEKRLKRLINALRTLQDQYEKLKAAGAKDTDIQNLFKGLYPELIEENGESFVTDLKYLERAVGLVEELEKLAPEDAKKILVDLGKDEFSVYLNNLQKQNKAYKASAEAAGKYFNELRKWSAEDFNIEGTGTAFDIGKIASDLRESFNEIDLRAQKMSEMLAQVDLGSEKSIAEVKALFEKEFGEGSWDTFYKEFQKESDKAFDTLSKKQKAYEVKLAQDRIDSLAQSYVSDITSDLDMRDWGDKSLGQIEYIRQELLKLLNADLPISDTMKSELKKLGLTTDDLIKKIKELLGGDYNNTVVEKFKKVQDVASEISSASSDLGGAFASLGEAMGSEVLTDAGKLLKTFGKVADILVECDAFMANISSLLNKSGDGAEDVADELSNIAQSSDWITLILKVVLLAIEGIANVIATQRKNAEAGFQAVLNYQKALRDIARESTETEFGSDSIKLLTENLRIATDAANAFHDALGEAMSADRGVGGWTLPSIGGEGGESFKFTTIRDLQTLLKKKDFESEREMMEYLKANLEVWEGWTHFSDGIRTTKELEAEIAHLIDLYGEWMDATEQVKASMTDMFGQLGQDIASNMINSFIEVGNATANLEQSFESLGETILQSFLQSAVIEGVLMPYLDEITDATTLAANGGISLEDYAAQMGIITESMKNDISTLAPYWESVMSAFQENGLLPDTSEEGVSDLASGIKGITEDQANLLASYLNAIRADVSYSKTLWQRMDANLQRIADMFVSSPTLMEYQAQIAANTYDTAVATQAILARLEGIITYDSGDASIRVYS